MTYYKGRTVEEAVRNAVRGIKQDDTDTPRQFSGPHWTHTSDCGFGRGRCGTQFGTAVLGAARQIREIEKLSGRGRSSHGSLVYRQMFGNFTWSRPTDRGGHFPGVQYEDGFNRALAWVRGQGYHRYPNEREMIDSRQPPSNFASELRQIANNIGNTDFLVYCVVHAVRNRDTGAMLPAQVIEVTQSGGASVWATG